MEIDESVTFNIHLTAVAEREPKSKRIRILSTEKEVLTEESLKASFIQGIKSGWTIQEDPFRELQVSPLKVEVRVESRKDNYGDFCVLVYDDPEDNSYVIKVRWLTFTEDAEENLTMNDVKHIYENGKELVRVLFDWVVETLL